MRLPFVLALIGCNEHALPPPPPSCGDGIIDSGEQCDDGNTTGNDGCSALCETETELTVRWSLTTIAGDTAPCPDGSIVDLISIPAGGSVLSPGTLDERFSCGVHEIELLRASNEWAFVWRLFDAAGNELGDAEVDDTASRDVSFDIIADGGFVEVSWDDHAGGPRTDCAAYGATTVHAALTPSPTPLAIDAPCTNPVVLGPIPAGSYVVDLTIGSATAEIQAVAVKPFGATNVLPVLDLPVPLH